MSDNLKIHDMVCYWIDVLGLKGWTITTEAISIESVAYADDVPVYDRYFVGVEIDREKMKACIYHDCPLNKEYIVHELLHVKYPEWSEDQVNAETDRLITQNKDEPFIKWEPIEPIMDEFDKTLKLLHESTHEIEIRKSILMVQEYKTTYLDN